LEFRLSDGEGCAFHDVACVAGEFKIAMIGGAAGRDEVSIVDANDC